MAGEQAEELGAPIRGGGRAWASTIAKFAPLAACYAAVLLGVFAVDYLPTTDGPQHLLASHIRNHYGDPNTDYATYLRPQLPYAEAGFALVHGPLAKVLAWDGALRITLALMGIGWVSACAFVASGMGGRREISVALASLAFFSWPLFMGFHAFVIGSTIGLFAVGVALRGADLPWTRVGLLALLFSGMGVAHVSSAAFIGLALGIFVLAANPLSRAPVLVGKLLLIGAPALAIVAHLVWVSRDSRASHDVEFLSVVDALSAIPGFALPGPQWRGWMIFVVAGAFGVAGVVRRTSRRDRALAATGLVLLVIGLAGPLNVPGWKYVSPRFVGMGIVLGALGFACPISVSPLAEAIGALAICVFGAATTVPFHRAYSNGCADAIAATKAQFPHRPRRGISLTIFLGETTCTGTPAGADEDVPFAEPLSAFGALYAVSHGGLPRFLHAGREGVHSFGGQRDAPLLPPAPPHGPYWRDLAASPSERRAGLAWLAGLAAAYDDVDVLSAQPADLASFEAWGFRRDFAQGGAFLGHLEPCPIAVTVQRSGRAPAFRVAHGVVPSPFEASSSATMDEGEGSSLHAAFARSVCGKVWLRAFAVPTDRAIPLQCEGAAITHDGAAVFDVRGPREIECRIATP